MKVLEEKAARMKQLIEDLVEASKASSGNLTVHAETLDFHQLVLQPAASSKTGFGWPIWMCVFGARRGLFPFWPMAGMCGACWRIC